MNRFTRNRRSQCGGERVIRIHMQIFCHKDQVHVHRITRNQGPSKGSILCACGVGNHYAICSDACERTFDLIFGPRKRQGIGTMRHTQRFRCPPLHLGSIGHVFLRVRDRCNAAPLQANLHLAVRRIPFQGTHIHGFTVNTWCTRDIQGAQPFIRNARIHASDALL